MDFHDFDTVYVFKVEESIADISTELPCLRDLENPQSTFGSRGTDDSVSRIFEIFTLFMFSRSGNPLLIFLHSYYVWVTLKIQVDFRFKTYLEVLVNVSYKFLKFLDVPQTIQPRSVLSRY